MLRTAALRPLFAFLAPLLLVLAALAAASAQGLPAVIAEVQPKLAKIWGAGGLRGLEPYQSGFLISAEGHILTAWSYVLDSDVITVMLNDGRKLEATVAGVDPRLEIAVLKVEAAGAAHFNLAEAATAEAGQRILAFSNLYGVATGDEPYSVLHGQVLAKSDLSARRGAFESNYRGPVYILDAVTNNPGAAGGALTDRRGRLLGILGKELRNARTSTWLNYAVPIGELTAAVDDILAGKLRPSARDETVKKAKEPHTLAALGLVLVPDFLARTPPFVELVRPGSPAAKAGVKPDDLILFVNERIVPSCKLTVEELEFIDRFDPIRLTLQRGAMLLEVTLTPAP